LIVQDATHQREQEFAFIQNWLESD